MRNLKIKQFLKRYQACKWFMVHKEEDFIIFEYTEYSTLF